MAKVVKIKQSDISKIVDSVVNEQIELSAPETVKDFEDENKRELELFLAKDAENNFYLLDKNGKVYISGK